MSKVLRGSEVRVDEPDEGRAVRMLRGVAQVMEKHHGVRILDDALVETVRLGIRYLPERQLPDKAVSLLDTACARVKLSQGATPPSLDDCHREIEHLDIETKAVDREQATGFDHTDRLKNLAERKEIVSARRDELQSSVRLKCARRLWVLKSRSKKTC